MPSNDDVREAWDALAGYWDEQVEAGETWQRHLIQPCVERLLDLRPGERVLEIACGNGEFARRMAELGGSVLATDFSEGMLERARARGGDVEYRRVDATDEDAVLALGEPASFDAVVSSMAIMDMSSIEPMASAVARLMRPGARFVLSTLHPAFNSGEAVPTTELVYRDGGVRKVHSVKASSYAKSLIAKAWPSPDRPSNTGTSIARCRSSCEHSSTTDSRSTGSRSLWSTLSVGQPDRPATCTRRSRACSSSGSARASKSSA